jgi:integrase
VQRGYLYKRSGSWLLRYYDVVIESGKTTRKQSAVKLASVKDYPTRSSVQLLADKHLAGLNAGTATPESSMTVLSFVEDVFFPAQEARLRASTVKDYKDIVRVHLKNRLGMRLRDFRTVIGQRILHEVTSARPDLSHQSLLRIKSFLSGVFTHAKIIGFWDGENPMVGVRVEGKRVKFHGKTYDSLEIWTMLMHSDDPAHPRPNLPPREKLVVATAALTGLRMAELRGLRWGDFDGENLHVKRSVWRTTVNNPKTESSEASVPAVAVLGDALKEYRKSLKEGAAADTAYIFAGERKGAPLNLANLARRVIIPAFKTSKIAWLGWHAFRRSTGSLLFDLGVEPKVIQQILRHADIRTTMNIYVKPDAVTARKAMKELGDNLLPFGY